MTSREISLQRAKELKSHTVGYMEYKKNNRAGTDAGYLAETELRKKKILQVLGAAQTDWDDYRWQFQNRIHESGLLSKLLDLSEKELKDVEDVSKKFRWAVTPYYLSLIEPDNPDDPIRKLSIPLHTELDGEGLADPMAEEFTNPAGIITRRYPDRLIFNVTNACAMYCRHCQRRRKIGETDQSVNRKLIDESIQYVRDNEEIRDVLITGGDPLTMSTKELEYIVSSVRAIPHVEIIRIGTRIPVTMPQRIDDELVTMLSKYHPLFMNLQFNHPIEMTPEAKAACEKLSNAGIPLGNQMVLLNGINNDKYIVRHLNSELLKARVRPYYIFHAKQVIGTSHFQTTIDDGLAIMEYLRGNTSGLAIPSYIVNAPGGQGKIPLLPNYIVDRKGDTVLLKNWEGKEIPYEMH